MTISRNCNGSSSSSSSSSSKTIAVKVRRRNRMTTSNNPGTVDVEITRIFDAPPELVWKAWTEPEHFMRWWGPKDFTSPAAKMDLRVGGKYLACMRTPEGQDMWSTGTYREIVPLERIVYTDSFADAEGNVVSAAHYG